MLFFKFDHDKKRQEETADAKKRKLLKFFEFWVKEKREEKREEGRKKEKSPVEKGIKLLTGIDLSFFQPDRWSGKSEKKVEKKEMRKKKKKLFDLFSSLLSFEILLWKK